MNNDLKHTIYNPTDCLSEKMLFDYIDNKLNQKERHIVEKHLLDCEMCSDACIYSIYKNRHFIKKMD